jgi:hypothetical protein
MIPDVHEEVDNIEQQMLYQFVEELPYSLLTYLLFILTLINKQEKHFKYLKIIEIYFNNTNFHVYKEMSDKYLYSIPLLMLYAMDALYNVDKVQKC